MPKLLSIRTRPIKINKGIGESIVAIVYVDPKSTMPAPAIEHSSGIIVDTNGTAARSTPSV